MLLCRCDCGEVLERRPLDVVTGAVGRCGSCGIEVRGTNIRNSKRKWQDDRLSGLTGKKFGCLTVIGHGGWGGKHRSLKLLCRCDCGKEHSASWGNIRAGVTKRCPACYELNRRKRGTKHGMSWTREWRIWTHMKGRCGNPKGRHYAYYGGRGIGFCLRWEEFTNFLHDMGPAPTASHTLDRIDSNGNYEPSNCRWATRKEQQRNLRNTKRATFRGTVASAADISDALHISRRFANECLRMGFTGDQVEVFMSQPRLLREG